MNRIKLLPDPNSTHIMSDLGHYYVVGRGPFRKIVKKNMHLFNKYLKRDIGKDAPGFAY